MKISVSRIARMLYAVATLWLIPMALHAQGDAQPTPIYCPVPDAPLLIPPTERPLAMAREVVKPRARFISQIYGIDVSHYQGAINWQLASIDEAVKYVYIKATESSGNVDPHFQNNLHHARKNGIPAGVYHFYRPTVSNAMQFTNFSQNVAGLEMDLIPIIDVEKRGRGSLVLFQKNLQTFLHQVERMFGVKPIIYTGVNFYNKYLAGRFTDYKFMIARYGGDDTPTLSDKVNIVMWQFTDRGYVGGIRGHVDRSCILPGYQLKDIMLPGKQKSAEPFLVLP